MRPTLTLERLSALLYYDPDTGLFRNKVNRNRCAIAGEVAGYTERNGYVMVKIDRKAHLAHRLAWFYMHGNWPSQQIDHINGNRADNRIANLRNVTACGNQQNIRCAQKNNRIGLLGVSRNGSNYAANIEAYGKRHYLGTFPTVDEAGAAYQAAKAQLHISAAA